MRPLAVDQMILGLIFSKDRAMQLDATLRSFFRQAADVNIVRMVVLYRTSADRHRAQYAELEGEYRGRVRFVRETEFRGQLLGLLKEASPARQALPGILRWMARPHSDDHLPAENCVLFLVDDALFVHPFRLGVATQALNSNSDALGFSFRLGRNTSNSYVLARTQALPAFEPMASGVLKFSWPQRDGDFAYPLELSSSLYRAPAVAGLFRRLRFSDPNTLESQMSLQARHFARVTPCLLCWDKSVAFSAPLNRVQDVFDNRGGRQEAFSAENMSDLFERGQRIDVAALDGFVPTACHQEVNLHFEQRHP